MNCLPQLGCRLVRVALAICALAVARVVAQYVTVGEVASLFPAPAGEPHLQTWHRLHPDFPGELRALDEPGYVIATRYLDARGQTLDRSVHGTHMLFERSVNDAFHGWLLVFAISTRKHGAAHVWVPIIFNPKSAAENGPDATPRLLAVAPVFVEKPADRPAEAFVIRLKLSLDATGAVTAITSSTPLAESLDRAVRSSLQKWRFAPARIAGRAVATSLTLPVLCQPTPNDYFVRVPPKPISRPSEYPPELYNTGLRAEVVVSFDLDISGAVKNPMVVTSTNPLFDAGSLTSLRAWKYQPATVDGQPVPAEGMRYTFRYDTRAGGQDAFETHEQIDQSKLRPELRFDTPAKMRGALAAVYPYALRREGATGTARVLAAIDTRGRVNGVKVVATDRPEFGRALVAALEGFTFDPALKDGKPVPYVLSYEKKFDRDRTPPFDPSDDLLALEKKHPERIVPLAALDAQITPVSRRPAVFPVSLPKGVESGTARLEVLIDEEGFVRLPRIVSASDEAFGYAAAQAASVWQYERPRKGGKPVVVRAQIPFSFALAETGPAQDHAN